MNMRPAILFLSNGSCCYDSTLYFERRISEELENLGYEAIHVSCPHDNPAAALAPLYGREYAAILDINTALPNARDADGSYCLDHIKSPIWHYILDHPLYHRDALKAEPNDFNVLCLDETHAAFIKKYYPHIKQAVCLPLAADCVVISRTSNHVYSLPSVTSCESIHGADSNAVTPSHYGDRADVNWERSIDVLFTGTYTDPDGVYRQAMRQPHDKAVLFNRAVQLLLDDPALTIEDAVTRCATTDDLTMLLLENHLIDVYLRAALREELLTQIVKAEVSITLYGHGWDIFYEKCRIAMPGHEKCLRVMGEVPYEKLPEIYADAKIALNQLPWFKGGMHDRIPLALRNGCVCLTDGNDYLRKRFADSKDVIYYSLEEMKKVPDIICKLLDTPYDASGCTPDGTRDMLGWDVWVENFLSISQ